MDPLIVCQIVKIYLNIINLLIKIEEIEKNILIFKLRNNELLIRLNSLLFENNIALLHEESLPKKRRFVKKPTYSNTGWWEKFVPEMNEELFKDDFRMNRTTFDYIVNSLKFGMKNELKSNSNAISIEKRVAIGLKVLGSAAEYKEIGKIFGIGKSTVCDCFKSFLAEALKILVPKHIRIPTEEEFKKIAEDFENKWGYPMAVGAIDGCHFPLNIADDLKVDYYNYKSFHSIVSIAICDANYKVWFVKSGIPGRTNDSGAFQQTSLYESLESGNVFPNIVRKFGETEVPYHILGDGAFQMKPWLIKPFVFRATVDPDEVYFNYSHSRARRVIENVFGLVKTRWRRTLKKMEIKLEDAGIMIQVAFALHNICEEFRDFPINDLTEKIDETSFLSKTNNVSTSEAQDIRNALKNYFKINKNN